MEYELLKELEDAKFPLKKSRKIIGFGNPTETTTGISTGNTPELDAGVIYLAPTLEELIGACGKGFWKLVQSGVWSAYADHPTVTGQNVVRDGDTPTTAVARLWLALNQEVASPNQPQ